MTIRDIINWFNPLKQAWWWESEWIGQNSYMVYEIIQENEGCSWDVEMYDVDHYKNKHTCEERLRIDKTIIVQETIFEHPNKKYDNMENIENVKLYQGPKYE